MITTTTVTCTVILLILLAGIILMITEAAKAMTLRCPKCGSYYVDDKNDDFFKCIDCGEEWV